jgi:hypothetical protein
MSSQQRNQTRIKPQFVDIHETLKKQIGNATDDSIFGAQAGAGGTIAGATISDKISFDDYYITLDTRESQSVDNLNGRFLFDLGPYMRETNTLVYQLENVVELTITEPFYIPKLTVNETFIFNRVLLTIQEVITSKGTSGRAAPPFHFSLTVRDVGLGRFELTPVEPSYFAIKPFRMATMTLQFSTPVNYGNFIPFPPITQIITYNSTTAFNTIFDNAADAGFVVGDVMYFTSNNPAIQNNPANAQFFRAIGHSITATIPFQVTIAGAYTILDGANLPVPVGTPFNVTLASRVIRVPFKIKTTKTGDGNNIIAVSN